MRGYHADAARKTRYTSRIMVSRGLIEEGIKGTPILYSNVLAPVPVRKAGLRMLRNEISGTL
jgi:hypothetical protein